MSFLKLVFALFLLGGCAIPPDANAPPDAFRSGFIDKSNVLTAELAAKALIAYNGGRYEEADLLLEEAESHLAKGAFSIPLAHNRAIILSRLKNFEKSAEIYEELIRRVPDSAALWFERGNLFSSWLKYEEAIAAYNQATSLALKERDYVLLKNIAQSESALHYLFGGINLSLIRSAESVGYVGINDELAATHGRLLLASGKFLSAKKFLTKFYPPPNFGTKGEVTYLLALSEIGLGHLSEADELTK
jgi:tetratricopeptide (TPR) repeat protein